MSGTGGGGRTASACEKRGMPGIGARYEAWWSGGLLREYGAASPMLYEFGGWEIARLGNGTVRRIRA